MTKIFLSLGSNIEPMMNLTAAIGLLSELGQVVAVSSAWQSAPVGFTAQPDFLNAAVLMESDMTPAAIYRDWIRPVEERLHRRRDPLNKNAPRTIDVDLALYGCETLDVLGHSIPDPEILTRPFVAFPLAELDGDFIHPVFQRSLRDIAASLPSNDLRQRVDVSLHLEGRQ